jgi:hypothetical protein
LTVSWTPRQPQLDAPQAATLDRALAAIRQQRIVLAIYGRPAAAPATPAMRRDYCKFVESLLLRYSRIRDVVIWNEPNKSYFWQPQFASRRESVAPQAYAMLLAECYPLLHRARPNVNVIAALGARGSGDRLARGGGPSPVSFISGMGRAYRELHMHGRLFDTFGQNVYGSSSQEPPTARHPSSGDIGEGDYDKLMSSLERAFARTEQPLPGRDGVTIWYMEDGFQSSIAPEKSNLYTSRENVPVVPFQTSSSNRRSHGEQLSAAIRLAYCQPAVGAFFNFLLEDEPDLARWQSGLLWTDGTQKPAYQAVKSVIAAVRNGAVRC